jgi:hypothetical protein
MNPANQMIKLFSSQETVDRHATDGDDQLRLHQSQLTGEERGA